MKLHDIILQEDFRPEDYPIPRKRKTVSEEELEKLFKGDYSSAYKKYMDNVMIYRGGSPYADAFIVTPKSGSTRVSRYAHGNYYNSMMSRFPEWSGYPKRSKSLICTTSRNKASNYGTVYAVFPKNKSVIGVCPWEDVFYSFSVVEKTLGLNNLNELNAAIDILHDTLVGDISGHGGVAEIRAIDDEIRAMGWDSFANTYNTPEWKPPLDRLYGRELRKLIKIMVDKKIPLEKLLRELMHPRKNHFEKETIESIDHSSTVNQEVWTDGECLLIHESKLDDFGL